MLVRHNIRFRTAFEAGKEMSYGQAVVIFFHHGIEAKKLCGNIHASQTQQTCFIPPGPVDFIEENFPC
jgi:hypothetical protein